MTDANPHRRTTGDPSSTHPGLAEGHSRLLLFAGMGGLALGTAVAVAPVVRVGVAAVAAAFALNTAGKLSHYGALPVPRGDRLKLSASWSLLALAVVGLLANYAHARYGSGDGRFFWTLAAAGVGLGLLHLAAQSKYLPEPDARTGQ